MPTLETKRLILRRIAMRDAKDVFAYSRDEEVARHVLWSAQKDLSEAKDSVTENVGDFVDEAKDNLSKVKDKAKEGINAAGEAVQKAYEKAKK